MLFLRDTPGRAAAVLARAGILYSKEKNEEMVLTNK